MSEHFQDFEILIVSNGSSEENETLLKDKIYSHSKIRVNISKSVGKGSAVRWGLENAKFENVIIYDSDFSYDLQLIHDFFVNGKLIIASLNLFSWILLKRFLGLVAVVKCPRTKSKFKFLKASLYL